MKNSPASPPAHCSRRKFLGATGAASAGFLILPSARTAFSYQANEQLNLGVIGVSGYAAATAFVPAVHIYDNLHITALCDVDLRKVAPAWKLWKERAESWPSSTKPEERKGAEHYRRLHEQRPPLFDDYRRMFDKMHKEIDAVVVATPDHSHAAASAEALHAGKHVLCEKPLTLTVHEARALYDLALRQKVATSLGNQGTQSQQFRRGVELIREGALGPVEQVHFWFKRGGRNLRQPPQGTKPVPEELNWDLWLGPVAWREYHPEWIARTHWRDTSAGELGNFGQHTGNLAFMALNLMELWSGAETPPIQVEAECSEVNRISFPVWERIRWQAPSRGAMPPVTVTWHQGRDLPPGSEELIHGLLRQHGASEEELTRLFPNTGAIIIGGKGALVTDSHNVKITLLPKERFDSVAIDKPLALPQSRGHYRDWLHACRGGEAPWANFGYATRFNEFLMLGDVATRFPGEKLEYSTSAGRILNHAEADQALSYEYRKGWRI